MLPKCQSLKYGDVVARLTEELKDRPIGHRWASSFSHVVVVGEAQVVEVVEVHCVALDADVVEKRTIAFHIDTRRKILDDPSPEKITAGVWQTGNTAKAAREAFTPCQWLDEAGLRQGRGDPEGVTMAELESDALRDNLAHIGDTVTLQNREGRHLLSRDHPLVGWAIQSVKSDDKGRIMEVYVTHPDSTLGYCLSGWVTNDGLQTIYVRVPAGG